MNTAIYNEIAEVAIISDVKFDKSMENKYLELFALRKEAGYIASDSDFYSNSWIITINGVNQSLNFPKEIMMKKMSNSFQVSMSEINLAYRSFLLYNMPKNVKTNDINRFIIDFIRGGRSRANMATYLLIFLKYLNADEDIYKYYEDIVNDMIQTRMVYSSKTLPKFEDIFLFSDIVNHILENNGMLEHKEYLMTLMWWKIVSLIPLRPSEFLKTKFNCVYEEDGDFYFQVKRAIKGRGTKIHRNTSKIEDCYTDDLITIDENTFNIINYYKDILVNDLDYCEGVFLFPREMLLNSGYYKSIKLSVNNKRINNDFILSHELKDNIIRFYKDIIEKEYGLKSIRNPNNTEDKSEEDCFISQLTPYDARHIAIMNLILMGNDPLTVMELAGHEDINTTFGYYNHVETFAEGYAIGYSKKFKNLRKYKKIESPIITNKFSRKIEFDDIMIEISGAKIEPIKVKGGYCHNPRFKADKSLCVLYEGKHSLCKYFKADSNDELLLSLEDGKAQLISEVRILVDLARDMSNVSKFNELYRVTGYKVQDRMNDIKHINSMLEEDD